MSPDMHSNSTNTELCPGTTEAASRELHEGAAHTEKPTTLGQLRQEVVGKVFLGRWHLEQSLEEELLADADHVYCIL